MITIVDYGVGNLRSVEKAVAFVGGKARITSSAAVIKRSSAVILPGVGAFGWAMNNLKKMGLLRTLKDHAARNKLFLGICLGYELMFENSNEEGLHEGLGLFSGKVRRFPFKGTSQRPVPHMGWNKLIVPRPSGTFDRLCDGKYVYFVHSYYVCSSDKTAAFVLADYGITFKAAVRRGNIFGCQFHPEKSGQDGLRIIDYFVKKAAR